MPSGVVRYQGKHGVTWRIRYMDATNKQQQETLGPEAEGWTRRKANRELLKRQGRVAEERDSGKASKAAPGKPETFESFAANWLVEYPLAEGLNKRTTKGYRGINKNHLTPFFGPYALSGITVALIDSYKAAKRRQLYKGRHYTGRTINRHLNLLSVMLNTAIKQEAALDANRVAAAGRVKEEKPEWRIFDPPQVRAIERGFAELIAEVEVVVEEWLWRQTCRVAFLTLQEIGPRRGEVRGLRRGSCALADPAGPRLRVCEQFIEGEWDAPKTDAGFRTVPISQYLAAELMDQLGRSIWTGDDDPVFCSPTRGTPFDPRRYAETFRKAVTRAGIGGYVRPFQDGRHSAITNGQRMGRKEQAAMVMAGHGDSRVTRIYTHLAGEMFQEEGERMSEALWGSRVQNPGTKPGEEAGETAEVAATMPGPAPWPSG